MAKVFVILGALFAVLAPILYHITNVSWTGSSLLGNIFPIFGLLAFTLLWLHAMSGVFEEWLRERFNFDAFVSFTAIVILVSMLAHPLLLLVLLKFNLDFLFSGNLGITLGLVGLLLLLTYDVGKLFSRTNFVQKHWEKILVVSTVGFLLAFFHSLLIGSDFQEGFMRYVWYCYGATAILATLYTYGYKRLTRARS